MCDVMCDVCMWLCECACVFVSVHVIVWMCSSYVYICLCLFLFLFTPTPIPIHSTSIQWKTWSDSVIADQLSYLNHAMLSAIPLTQFITWAYSKSKVCLYYYYNIILYFFNFFNYIFFHFLSFFFFFFSSSFHTRHTYRSLSAVSCGSSFSISIALCIGLLLK